MLGGDLLHGELGQAGYVDVVRVLAELVPVELVDGQRLLLPPHRPVAHVPHRRLESRLGELLGLRAREHVLELY